MEYRTLKISDDLAPFLYPEKGRLSTPKRVEALLEAKGPGQFGNVALAVRKVYQERGQTVDAAGKCLTRAWNNCFPDTVTPSFPKGFWAEANFDVSASFSGSFVGVLPDKRFGSMTLVGSVGSVGNYLRGEWPTTLRPN